MYPEYPEELKMLQPGDLFKVDFGERRLSDVRKCYHKYVGIWMEITKVIPENQRRGSLAYKAVALAKHNPGLPSDFQTVAEMKCEWRPGDDFKECKRPAKVPDSVFAKKSLPEF